MIQPAPYSASLPFPAAKWQFLLPPWPGLREFFMAKSRDAKHLRSFRMKTKPICILSILSTFIFFIGCATDLNQYQPKSVEEEAVIKAVMEHERTWNEHNPTRFLATYHGSAKIEYKCKGQMLSKNEFAAKISQLMTDYPTARLVNPTVAVSGKEAVIKGTTTEMGDKNHNFRIEMLKENDRWYIIQESCY